MLNDRMLASLNDQTNAEIYSAYMYLSMAAYMDSQDLPGAASWLKAQAQEELMHGMKFFNYIHERGGKAVLTAIEAPPVEWDSPLTAAEAVLDHERKVTDLINDLVNLAIELRDHATNQFLQWFVAEQVEEEDSASRLVEQFRLAGDRGPGLLMLDKELSQRVFVYPVQGQTE